MARKSTKRIEAVATTAEVLKVVRLELPVPLHHQLRVEAAKADSNMSALARIAVEQFLARATKGAK